LAYQLSGLLIERPQAFLSFSLEQVNLDLIRFHLFPDAIDSYDTLVDSRLYVSGFGVSLNGYWIVHIDPSGRILTFVKARLNKTSVHLVSRPAYGDLTIVLFPAAVASCSSPLSVYDHCALPTRLSTREGPCSILKLLAHP
jgi:hypothetical protein